MEEKEKPQVSSGPCLEVHGLIGVVLHGFSFKSTSSDDAIHRFVMVRQSYRHLASGRFVACSKLDNSFCSSTTPLSCSSANMLACKLYSCTVLLMMMSIRSHN